MLDGFFDRSVDDKGLIDDPDLIAIKFGSVPDFCLIEVDTASDDVVSFTS